MKKNGQVTLYERTNIILELPNAVPRRAADSTVPKGRLTIDEDLAVSTAVEAVEGEDSPPGCAEVLLQAPNHGKCIFAM